jgi:acyl-CoA synthetase (AMP-forming)/AMP-acid ligase II
VPFPEIVPTVPTLVRAAADAHGDVPLLIADNQVLSYRDADQRSRGLALGLLAKGVRKGDHVGILMPSGVDWAVAWFAVTRIGGVAVPINTFYKAPELAWTVAHADLAFLLTADRFLSNDYLERLEEALPGLAEQRATSGALFLAAAPFLRVIAVWGEGHRQWACRGAETLAADGVAAGLDDEYLGAIESAITSCRSWSPPSGAA